MKIAHPLASLLALTLLAGPALGQEGTQDFQSQVLSTKTRAEVLAELREARASGALDLRGETYGSFDPRQVASTRSRAEVLAELDASRRVRAADVHGHASVYGSFRPGEIGSTRSRDEVRAELAAAVEARKGLSRGDRIGG